MEHPSLKKAIIAGFWNGVTQENLKGNALALVTAAGIIEGYPVTQEESEALKQKKNFAEMSDKEKSVCMTSILTDSAERVYDENYKVNHPVPGNDGYILLKNVTFRSANATYCLETLVVFFDQIIGVSFGRIN
jgi:hypothetical protein